MPNMNEGLLWAIGSADGRSEQLVDNYKEPNLPGNVTWRVAGADNQRWPLFHPSEADPDGGYRLHPYTILFDLETPPQGAYALRIQYLVIAPRLAYLEVKVNGTAGELFLRPEPSRSGEIRLLSGLHTTIYSEGVAEVIIPAALLRQGENQLELIARDGGEYIHVDRIEAIKRLDRMANGAGFLYQLITFSALPSGPAVKAAAEPGGHPSPGPLRRLELLPSVLYRRTPGGGLAERCYLYLELNRPLEAGQATLLLREGDRSQEVTFDLSPAVFGHIRLEFDLFDGEGEVAWLLDGGLGHWVGKLKRRRKWKVFLTPHAHTDIGYTHRQWEVAERLCRNIDYALETIAAHGDGAGGPPPFTYHLDSSWTLEQYLQTRSPERTLQFFAAMKAGLIGVAGNYVDLLTQISGLEDLIRNQTMTHGLLQRGEVATDFNAVVDVASITSSMPAILEGAGIRYLVHANNQDRGPFRLLGGLHRISPFWWEGQNGGRVLVWLSKMYTELRKVCGSPPVPDSAERGLEMWLQEYEHENYAPDGVMLYGQEADNTDLDPQPVSFVQRWNETYEYPKLIPCDVSQFFRYVEERFADRFQTVKGDSGAYWEDGAGSSIAQTIAVRQAQAALPAAERLEALAALHTPGWAFPLGQFDEAWRQVLLYDEHTWGAFMSAREPHALLTHDQWAVKEGFARESEAWAKRLLHTAAVRHSLNWNNDGREVVVYNPHSWTVSGTITVEIEPNEIPVEPDTGMPVPMRRVKSLSSQAICELWVENLEGLSYRRFVLERVDDPLGVARTEERVLAARESGEAGAAGAGTAGTTGAGTAGTTGAGTAGTTGAGEAAVLENDFYRLLFDPARGAVISWIDKDLERELVDQAEGWGFGRLLYARGGEGTRLISNQADLPDGDPSVLDTFEATGALLRRFEYGTSMLLTGETACGPLTITWTLPDRAKWVDVAFALNKVERLEKEAIYIAFPLALPDATVESDSQLGWVDWDKQMLPGGCKEWLPLQSAILASGEGARVQICSPDIPLFTVGSVVRGRWPKEMDLTGGRIFSYVLNNYWHTNYKGSQGGEIRFGYRLTSGAAIGKDAAYRLGWETRRGLYGHRISFQDFREGREPYAAAAGGTLARVGTEQVVLSTMTRARQGEGYIIRLQEIAGAAQVAPVEIPGRKIRRAWLTNLLEQELHQIPVRVDGSLHVPVPAWGLATVRVEF